MDRESSSAEVIAMYKKIILIILAIIGVLAPCVVTVNLHRACEEERVIECCIDVYEEAIATQETCGARLRIHIFAEKIKSCFRELVETAVAYGYTDRDREKPTETRKTYMFYSRQAGGLPSGTLSPI